MTFGSHHFRKNAPAMDLVLSCVDFRVHFVMCTFCKSSPDLRVVRSLSLFLPLFCAFDFPTLLRPSSWIHCDPLSFLSRGRRFALIEAMFNREESLEEDLQEAGCDFLQREVSVVSKDGGMIQVDLPRVFEWYSLDFGTGRKDQLRNICPFLRDPERAILEECLLRNGTMKVKIKVVEISSRLLLLVLISPPIVLSCSLLPPCLLFFLGSVPPSLFLLACTIPLRVVFPDLVV